MCTQKVTAALVVLFLASLFITCGELDTVLPSSGTYQVSALVNNSSLNESSLLAKNDRISPYFATSVTGDPDIQGLLVFLQTPAAEIVGAKIHYTLKPAEEEPGENKSDTKNGETEREIPVSGNQDTETGENPSPAEPVQTTEPAKTKTEILIHVNRLDKDLPSFSLPETLTIGQYTMVFQVLGKKDILYQAEKQVYYLDDADFFLNDIQRYLPDVSNGSYLIPPGIAIMLEAKVAADERLDPYIVWYNGKKRIGEGRFSEGAGLILWKAPEQTGFHTVRVEAFPYQPAAGIYGKSREISIPVSSKAADAGYFSGESEYITHWYQFRGNLQDSKVPVATERALIPKGEKVSQWTAQNNIYGLAVGPRDIYLLPAFASTSAEKKPGTGRFMFRFKPAGEGTVFSASFKSESSPSDSVYMDLVLSPETLLLNITAPGLSEVIPADYAPEEAEGFITLFIDFSMTENRMGIKLNRETAPPVPPEPKIITLSDPLSGEGGFQFGASLDTAETGGANSTDHAIPAEGPERIPITAILDEFAFGWLENSFLFEEPATLSEPVPAEEPEPDQVSGEQAPPEPEDHVSEEQPLPEPADVS
jgi:hypothetical protein